MVRSAGLVPAALLAALLLPSPSPAATTGGTPVGSGDRITGTIDGPSDTDAFLIEAPAGSRLQVEVKAGRKSALLPLLAVRRPDGTAVDLSRIVVGENGPVVSVTDLGVPVSGAWTVEVRGMGSTAGDYQALIGAEVDRKLRTTVEVPAGGTVVRDFTAWDGVQVAWSAREAGGAGLAEAGLCCPHRNPIAGTEGVRKGARIVGPKSVLGRGPGLYGLVLRGSDAGPTTVEVKVSLRFPKVKRSKVGLGEEPRPGSFSPTVGRDGTQVVLTGTGFVEGSRVFFDGDHEADAVLAGDTLTVTCPPCPASDAGEAVSVTVLNPDGQTGTAADSFQYLGVPRPLGASPLLSPVEGGERIRVHGSGFRAGFTVLFDGVPAPDTDVDTPGLLTCWTPAHAEDVVDVVVLDEFGRPGASIPGFRFADPPVVDVATPATLPSHGGRTVALAGSHFVPGDRVFLDGVEASGVAVQGWNGLSFTAPAGSAGPVEIEVRDPLGRSWIGSGLLEFTPSLVSAAGLLPPAPTGADFFGDALVVGDCTGDGLPDLVISSPVARTNSVTKATAPSTSLLVNDGSGRFANRTFSLPAPTAVESGQADALSVGDLDGDGASEILLSRESPPRAAADTVLYAGLPAYYRVDPSSTSWDRPTLRATRLLAADAGGTFSDDGGTRLPDPGVPPCEGFGERWQASASALGDLDGDGGDDLVLAAGGEVREGTIADVYWIQKKMKYGYWPYYYYYYVREKSYLTEESARKGALRPLMNAGKGVLEDRGNGPGLLTDSGKAILDDFRGSACAAGDLDGDGDRDVVVVGASRGLREIDGEVLPASAVRVLLNDGSGSLAFAPEATPSSYADGHPESADFTHGESAILGDLDGDGDPDLVVGRPKFNYWVDGEGRSRVLPALRILRNDGGTFREDTGGFLPDSLFRAGGGPTILGARGLAAADLDGDGDLDLLVTGWETTVPDAGGGKGSRGILDAGTRAATRVLLNDGAGTFSDATDDWLDGSGGDLMRGDALAVEDLDGDGRPDIALVMDQSPAAGLRPLRLFLVK